MQSGVGVALYVRARVDIKEGGEVWAEVEDSKVGMVEDGVPVVMVKCDAGRCCIGMLM